MEKSSSTLPNQCEMDVTRDLKNSCKNYISNRTTANAIVVSRLALEDNNLNWPQLRVAFLSDFTVEPLIAHVQADAICRRFTIQPYVAPFSAYMQEALDPNSGIYKFDPQIVVLAIRGCDLLPSLYKWSSDNTQPSLMIDQTLTWLRSWVFAIRAKSSASLLLMLPEFPDLADGVSDEIGSEGQTAIVEGLRNGIRALAREHAGVYIADFQRIISYMGHSQWVDERLWSIARQPFCVDALNAISSEIMRILVPLAGRSCKVIACDLDNTLWGGIVGEDGLQNLHVGDDPKGYPYQLLQQSLLFIKQRGLVLAISSKNNEPEALEAIEQHPGMLLRRKDFVAARINWKDKPTNLREIAAELNVGIDAISLIDDNHVECERVRTELPDVHVIQVNSDPSITARELLIDPKFEVLSISNEDRKRTQMYLQRAAQEQIRMESQAIDLTNFYKDLQQQAIVELPGQNNTTRVAQLTQKTNQFNLTTRRYTESDIAAMLKDPDWRVFPMRLLDRFGDNGIVALALIKYNGSEAHIDTFLMSCRVIQRTVETALLAHICQVVKNAGIEILTAEFIPTAKNAPAAEFLPKHGFRLEGDGIWHLDLNNTPSVPDWIELIIQDEHNNNNNE